MTGRELIIYILENNLEDESIFSDNMFNGFITLDKAAVELNTGIETVKVLFERNMLSGFKIEDNYYIFSKDIERFKSKNKGG